MTVSEFLAFLATRPPQTREAIATAPVETLESDLLMGLAQRELLILEAEERGLGPNEARRDSLTIQARESFAQAGRMMGFFALNVLAEEQGVEDPVAVAVEARLLEIVSNQREVLPLGPVGFTLRQGARTELFEAGIIDAVNRIEEIRGPQQEPTAPQTPAVSDSAAAADAVGAGN